MRARNRTSGEAGAGGSAATRLSAAAGAIGCATTRFGAERGVALITVVIILMFLGALGTALIAIVYSRLTAVTLEVDRLQAQYLAEAGIAQGLHEIKTGLDVFGGGRGAIPVTALGPGFYKVDIDPKTSTLTAIGVVRDVRRVIVTKYE